MAAAMRMRRSGRKTCGVRRRRPLGLGCLPDLGLGLLLSLLDLPRLHLPTLRRRLLGPSPRD
ncbi:hypothetical protein [Methylobacterium sp. R2-1]|uniref:hypothetical protein n=1 Tax=Methylobacterium sp. R2-1 TaxID=2587064 RepID=UPI001616C190|nr:hypothetical protein [Methylobacterium sp. R2-1]MBB2962381.1 hypothetical protein [Methylobacterium sp. R2-1]